MSGKLITIVVTAIAAMAALVAGAVSADVIPEPGAFVDQVNLLAEDVGDQGIERAPFPPAAVAVPIDDRAPGFFDRLDDRNLMQILEPTYRAGVAGAVLLNDTCGYYPWICVNQDMDRALSVGAVQSPVDDGGLGFFELHDDWTWLQILSPEPQPGVSSAEALSATCIEFPWTCVGMRDGL